MKVFIKQNILNISLFAVLFALVGATVYVSYSIMNMFNEDNNSYVLRDIVSTDDYINSVSKTTKELYNIPYYSDNVSILVDFYNNNDERDIQEKSIILVDNTYLPNTGILYTSNEIFDVVSSFKGIVTKIEDTELFGKRIEITYDNNIIAVYSSLSEVSVTKDQTVESGTIIGKSGINQISTQSNNMLLFELIINGEHVDPNNYFNYEIEKMD